MAKLSTRQIWRYVCKHSRPSATSFPSKSLDYISKGPDLIMVLAHIVVSFFFTNFILKLNCILCSLKYKVPCFKKADSVLLAENLRSHMNKGI